MFWIFRPLKYPKKQKEKLLKVIRIMYAIQWQQNKILLLIKTLVEGQIIIEQYVKINPGPS